ncbi:MAG TPA: metal-dependent hydrolase, partial [Acidobacteriota bacterium]
MPLPVGHALAGIAFQQARPGLFFKNLWHDAFFFIFLANLPDADFLPGLLMGRPNLFHHGIFHSLGAALAIAAVGGWLFSRNKKYSWPAALGIFLIFS